MNSQKLSNPFGRILYRAVLSLRNLRPIPRSTAFGGGQTVQRIYVINLDRHSERWRRISSELRRVPDSEGRRLTSYVQRLGGVDARYHIDEPDGELQHEYSLADQLFVDPQPISRSVRDTRTLRTRISAQEAAVARSHIAVWKLIAERDAPYALVLEDDVYLGWRFPRLLNRAWAEIEREAEHPAFDLLYVSYKEALKGADMYPVSEWLMRPRRGLWQLSGYVLSREGAQRLLKLLPVVGPVDLWMNRQFEELDVLAIWKSAIHQRLDNRSSNSYSVLPLLAQVGLLTHEKSASPETTDLARPVIAVGQPRTGLTSLATALSMIGYRCCSDLATLPATERRALLGHHRDRVFDAYVNVGDLTVEDLVKVADLYPQARFIATTEGEGDLGAREIHSVSDRLLLLPADHHDKWQLLSEFLGGDYPSHRYPDEPERGQTAVLDQPLNHIQVRRLKWDSLPWIVEQSEWPGSAFESVRSGTDWMPVVIEDFRGLAWPDEDLWTLRDDTFPDNLSLFTPSNFETSCGRAALILRDESVVVRDYTSASLSTRDAYRYGRFIAELKPANVAGVVTGMFLHRNSPRQEIDIEFLGHDTSKLLANVYYNPGYEGARIEYGYRGTPVLIDLGFDAAEKFHRYEIEWTPSTIRWLVDGESVHERRHWSPTPVPHLPMQFHLNLWPPRSITLAGRMSRYALPARAELRRIEVHR